MQQLSLLHRMSLVSHRLLLTPMGDGMKRRECVALLGATVVCCHGVEELGNIQSGQ